MDDEQHSFLLFMNPFILKKANFENLSTEESFIRVNFENFKTVVVLDGIFILQINLSWRKYTLKTSTDLWMVHWFLTLETDLLEVCIYQN